MLTAWLQTESIASTPFKCLTIRDSTLEIPHLLKHLEFSGFGCISRNAFFSCVVYRIHSSSNCTAVEPVKLVPNSFHCLDQEEFKFQNFIAFQIALC